MRVISKSYNPAMLTWAREQSGHSIEAAAKALRLKVDQYEKLEKGDDYPSMSQLNNLAKKYSRPLGVFYLPEAPKPKRRPKKDYRSKSLRQFGPKFMKSLRKASFIQNSFSLLFSDAKQDVYWKINDNPVKNAELAKEWLGIDDNLQTRNRDVRGFLNDLICRLENKGLLVIVHSFPSNEAKAYSIHGDPGVIVLTSNDPYLGSRLFSLLHELCHLSKGDSGICITNTNTDYKIERACDKFATHFLMPKRLVDSIFEKTNGQFLDNDNLKFVADCLKSSQYALLIRLKELGYITETQFYAKKLEWKNLPKKKRGGGVGQTKAELVVRENGLVYTSKVFDSYERGEINPTDAGYFLGVNQGYINEVGEKVANK